MVFVELRRDSRVTTGISDFPLGWPWEAQSSPRVARVRFLPPLEVRPSSVAPDPAESRGCTHTPDLEEGSSLLQATQQMGRRIPNKGEGAHTHTPDLEEGSSLLQATQQMGRRIPNKGEGAHTLQTSKKAHLCFRPHSKWAEGSHSFPTRD